MRVAVLSVYVLSSIMICLSACRDPRVREEPRGQMVAWPKVMLILSSDLSDEEVIGELKKEPTLIEYSFQDAPVYYMRLPILAAVEYRRKEVAKYMIAQGVSVKRALQVLRAADDEGYLTGGEQRLLREWAQQVGE